MDHRTTEGPMEWAWENKGPLPQNSPWTSRVNNHQPSQNLFGSPSKFGARPNQPSHTPSKPLPPVPQSSLFNPHIQQSNTAPPFRNPAFHTPRKPFDDAPFSEAESSPALTEHSDLLDDDTPEADRFADLNMGTGSSYKVDKTLRYSKASHHLARRHAPGKGEISRSSRDYPALRKRKRLAGDRDVGSLRMHPSGQDSDGDYEEYDSDPAAHAKGRSGKRQGKSWLANTFDLISAHPSMPDHLSRWFTFLVNVTVVCVIGFCGWTVWSTVRDDIATANAKNRHDIVAKATACQNQFELNGCDKKDRPALRELCDEWDACRFQDPESIMVVKNTAKQVALVINEFASNMEMRGMLFLFGVLFICFGLNHWKSSMGTPIPKASTPIPPTPAAAHGHPPPSAFHEASQQAYMYIPIQTPSHRRQIEMDDDATDTDGASPPVRRALLPPPQTPSRRHSPSKEGRTRSPVKTGRKTSRDYY